MESGTRLGQYEIVGPLGAGGMGEVYRARDTQLDRDVAIKVLPEGLDSHPDRLARFVREAKLLASLNHANIATVYGFEECGGVRCIAMEVVEGETLAAHLERGPLPVELALGIGARIADALEAAHDKGIIHRDLKPANIMLTADWKVKVLDFGLAKAFEAEAPEQDLSRSPTIAVATQAGVILGTAPYMSPEQARGQPLDKRTDIWSFGCVLYEMLTARPAFAAGTVSDTMAAILKADPDWGVLPGDTPPSAARLLRRCLAKDAGNRLHDIRDARLDLADAQGEAAVGTSSGETPSRNTGSLRFSRLGVAALTMAAVGTFIGGGVVGRWTAPEPASSTTTRFSIRLLANAPLTLGRGLPLGFDLPLFAVSPDGTRLIYVADLGARTQLYLVEVGAFGAVPLEGTEGAYGVPLFSPDGESVAFFAGDELRKVPVTGGNSELLANLGGGVWGAAWHGDMIYVATDMASVIQRVPATGGTPEVVALSTELEGATSFGALDALPNGKGLLVSTTRAVPISADYRDIHWWSPETNEWKLVLPAAGYAPRYSPSGHLVYARAGGLRAVPFDLETLQVTGDGEPALLVDDVRVDSQFGNAQYAFAENGSLFYVRGGDMGLGIPTWVDRQGNAEPVPSMPEATYGMFTLSPNGDRLAIQVGGPTDQVWIYDLTDGGGQRLTTSGNNGWPVWWDDARVLYVTRQDDGWTLNVRRADGGGEAETLYSRQQRIITFGSPANDVIVLNAGDTVVETIFLSLDTDGPATAITHGRTGEWGHQFSPDGGWLAYVSQRDGPYEVFVSRYPELDREIKVSAGGGTEPLWSKRTDQLYYHNGNQWMVSDVSVDGDSAPTPGREVLRAPFVDTMAISWEIGPDDRLLIISPTAEASDLREIRVVLNWFEELKQRVPTGR